MEYPGRIPMVGRLRFNSIVLYDLKYENRSSLAHILAVNLDLDIAIVFYDSILF